MDSIRTEGGDVIRIPRIYIPADSIHDEITLDSEQSHYLKNVLRTAKSDVIISFDGAGRVDIWEHVGVAGGKVTLRHRDSASGPRSAPINLTLALNPLKGSAEEDAIRAAAAFEVNKLIPVIFERSDIPWDKESLSKRREKWSKWCESEVAQSGGAWLPEIGEPAILKEFLSISRSGFIFFEETTAPIERPEISSGSDIVALVGPEGGIEEDELNQAISSGLKIATLGPWILRARLAASMVPLWIYSHVH
ncbi:MAG TPA: RsmE family RNA methyltransferase [bacterium]